jgi:hypothetical protein
MTNPTSPSEAHLLCTAFEQTLQRDGLHAALALLNAATPYRLTGVYRFEGDLVRSVLLFDRKNPHLTVGADVPWNDSYCRITSEHGSRCEITNAPEDSRLTGHAARAAVQAYVAVLLRAPDGSPLGTLCHYDLNPVTVPRGLFDVLETVGPVVERSLWGMLRLSRLPRRAIKVGGTSSASTMAKRPVRAASRAK